MCCPVAGETKMLLVNMKLDKHGQLVNELYYLCSVRGELDYVTNKAIETRLEEIDNELKVEYEDSED